MEIRFRHEQRMPEKESLRKMTTASALVNYSQDGSLGTERYVKKDNFFFFERWVQMAEIIKNYWQAILNKISPMSRLEKQFSSNLN